MSTTTSKSPELASRLVNGLLGVKPLANLAKNQARKMMVKRAEKLGIPWTETVDKLQKRDWEEDWQAVVNPDLAYPKYYLTSFHAYDEGNLSWKPALEVESAALAVHSGIWEGAGIQGDSKLRQSYHEIVQELDIHPRDILDIGCSAGMSSFALQKLYPDAKLTGLDLSPYFLAVARYNAQERSVDINWHHAPAEATGLPDQSFDLVSACLLFHELPQKAAKEIFIEARRLLRPGGYLSIMDMNPASEAYRKMPAYIFTLLKSTEPYLDQYFNLDISQALEAAGFTTPTIRSNSPRHRTIIAQVR